MYQAMVRRLVRWAFERLSQRDIDTLLGHCSPCMEHQFAGNHALGGSRRGTHDCRRWLERLFRLFPELRFHIHEIMVVGPPWNTRAVVTWTDEGRAADGAPYRNHGTHVLRLRAGRLTQIHAHLDTQCVEQTLNRLAESGIEEARATPIGGDHD